MTVEVRESFVFTPDGPSLRSERVAEHLRRTDCTDPTRGEHIRAPLAVRIVTID
jgi:hypothetical protein